MEPRLDAALSTHEHGNQTMTGKRHIPTRRNPMATVLATYTRKGRRQPAFAEAKLRLRAGRPAPLSE